MPYTTDGAASKIAEALGGSLVPDAKGNFLCSCPCPGHADFRPSLSLCDREGKVLLHCFAGCRQQDVIAALQRLKLWSGRPSQNAHATRPATPAKPAQPPRATDSLKPWRDASPIVAGSLIELYLRNRELEIPAGAPLRYAPALWHWPTKTRYPAMVALIARYDGSPVTSHSTFLSHDGRKADIEPVRLFSAGANPSGSGIWFHGLGSRLELVIAEGLETALSAARLCDAEAAVATLSTHGMRTLVLAEKTRRPIRIFADNDRAGHGLAAARDLYRRLRSEGREVLVTVPDDVGADANDILIRRARA